MQIKFHEPTQVRVEMYTTIYSKAAVGVHHSDVL